MKFQNYLIEDNKSLAYYTKKIQVECKPFIKEIKGAAGTLTRHDVKHGLDPAWKKITRKDRRPLDTPKQFHDMIDNWFNKNFGWKSRSSGLFCWGTPFPLLASDWMVFPAGNFKYIWSPKITDLYGHVEFIFDMAKAKARKHDDLQSEMEPAIKEAWKEMKKEFSKYTNKNLKKAVVSRKEIMVDCDYSYLVKQELIENVNELLDLRWQSAKFIGRRI